MAKWSRVTLTALLGLVLLTPAVSFAGAQQNKMKTCNADADAIHQDIARVALLDRGGVREPAGQPESEP